MILILQSFKSFDKLFIHYNKNKLFKKNYNNKKPTYFLFNPLAVMLASIPLVVLTILIYINIPELYNFSGKCFVCLLVTGLLILISNSWKNLTKWTYLEPLVCKTIATLLYFSVLSASLWLNIASFNIWQLTR